MTQAQSVAIESSQINSSGVLLTTGGGTGLSTVGTNGQVLTSNGTTLSWVTPTTTSPGGSTTQVQYNNSGSFAGSSSFVFDGTNVGIGTSSPSSYGKFVTYSSGGYAYIDTNGQIWSYQSLDVATAGGRLTGGSNQGYLGDIGIEQTTTGAKGGYIRFNTAPTGSNTSTERMRIASNGAVLVGSTSLLSSQSNFQINCTSGGGVGGANPTPSVLFNYSAAGGGGSFNTLALHYNTSTVGNGSALTFSGLDSAGARYTTALIGTVLTANTAAAPSASLSIYSLSAGSLNESLQIAPSGSVKLATAGTTINNSSGNPILRQTGSVLQVVQYVNTTQYYVTGTNTVFSTTFTPTASTSKVLMFWSIAFGLSNPNGGYQILRNGTSVQNAGGTYGGGSGYYSTDDFNGGLGSYSIFPGTWVYLDSPATTSAITYAFAINGGTDVYVNRTLNSTGSGYGTTTVIFMEIAG